MSFSIAHVWNSMRIIMIPNFSAIEGEISRHEYWHVKRQKAKTRYPFVIYYFFWPNPFMLIRNRSNTFCGAAWGRIIRIRNLIRLRCISPNKRNAEKKDASLFIQVKYLIQNFKIPHPPYMKSFRIYAAEETRTNLPFLFLPNNRQRALFVFCTFDFISLNFYGSFP